MRWSFKVLEQSKAALRIARGGADAQPCARRRGETIIPPADKKRGNPGSTATNMEKGIAT